MLFWFSLFEEYLCDNKNIPVIQFEDDPVYPEFPRFEGVETVLLIFKLCVVINPPCLMKYFEQIFDQPAVFGVNPGHGS